MQQYLKKSQTRCPKNLLPYAPCENQIQNLTKLNPVVLQTFVTKKSKLYKCYNSITLQKKFNAKRDQKF